MTVKMFLTKNEYDRGVNTFSPEGRLFQVEYAIEAIKVRTTQLGSTALGLVTTEGVVLAVEKRLSSPLMVPESVQKIFEIDSNIGCAMSGILADAYTLVDHARVEAQGHRFTFREEIKVESIAQSVCDRALHFGEGDGSSKRKPMARPYGVALLIAGVDRTGPALFHTDPSGTMFQYKAKAIGSAAEGAQALLQEQFHDNLTLESGVRLALEVLKQVMEDKITASNVQVSVVGPNRTFTTFSTEQVQTYLAAI